MNHDPLRLKAPILNNSKNKIIFRIEDVIRAFNAALVSSRTASFIREDELDINSSRSTIISDHHVIRQTPYVLQQPFRDAAVLILKRPHHLRYSEHYHFQGRYGLRELMSSPTSRESQLQPTLLTRSSTLTCITRKLMWTQAPCVTGWVRYIMLALIWIVSKNILITNLLFLYLHEIGNAL